LDIAPSSAIGVPQNNWTVFSRRHEMTIEARVKDRILKPPAEVFAAIVDSDQLVNFFPSSASGPLRAGETVTWNFADVGGGSISVRVKEIRQDRHIMFEWSASGGQPARVDIDLQPQDGNSTLVTIVEWTKRASSALCVRPKVGPTFSAA
jgi:uncharacterized protein YndB with AHSA1/START domain